MEKLEVGQSFEVVKVLDYGYAEKSLFKIGGFTVGVRGDYWTLLCMGNGSMPRSEEFWVKCMSTCYLYMFASEVKLIGKLTITKLK